ncbi:MAG: D-glycero-beta-D-manno-heptose 1-phosphate adenylyltransferase [Candidatus Omnitrophica bacterium]|nr:D-glycero-beta-D-manno-heptose 1-phosphate adenylyltransferase [Candidatus Omnitrophota bacterium]
MVDNSKIKTWDELISVIEHQRSSCRKIGFTNGCFDIIHLGHVRYLSEAKSLCDNLVVGVNSDASVKRIKGSSRPVNTEWVRMEVLAALECVDYVVMFEEDTPEELIKLVNPHVLIKGGDWKEEDIVGAGYVKKNGGSVKVIPYLEGFSTTNIIERMKELQDG